MRDESRYYQQLMGTSPRQAREEYNMQGIGKMGGLYFGDNLNVLCTWKLLYNKNLAIEHRGDFFILPRRRLE
jgi:hypothetical protein